MTSQKRQSILRLLMINLPTLKCHQCASEWIPRIPNPAVCPHCHSRLWQDGKTMSKKQRLRQKASALLTNAVRRGELKKPSSCESCGKKTKGNRLNGHHTDYTKPLAVIWLCKVCHGEIHTKIFDAQLKG